MIIVHFVRHSSIMHCRGGGGGGGMGGGVKMQYAFNYLMNKICTNI